MEGKSPMTTDRPDLDDAILVAPSDTDDEVERNRCPVCGEDYTAGQRECDTCGTPLAVNPASTLTVVLVLVVVCTGAIVVLPGLGVLLAIGSVAPIVRMTMVVRKRAQRGLDTPRWQQYALYFSSLWVTSIVLWTTGLAAFLAFCFSCLGVAVVTRGSEFSIAVALLVAGVVVVFLGWIFSGWIRKRWRKDIGAPDGEDG